ncbi:uncharacterized protein CMC5_018450 [Chondromyces crocatus]|uniref:Uncharacterized protein n=2 Tax=Chondromyces crocatus TaxID=52 RepID=A0A0K1EAV8_CHOCO|nr:uncharacterized protein CMC5_018450 [Chondromyces crocatus]
MQRALELVALRGRDVVGVRHILDGRAHVGADPAAVAHAVRGDLIAEVVGDRFTIFVPAGTRARLHQADGLARLLTGPVEVSLLEGDRAVLVLGEIQIRAQIVPVEVVSRDTTTSSRWGRSKGAGPTGVARWVGLVGAIYAVALTVCALFATPERVLLQQGVVGRAVSTAAAAAQASLLASNKPVVEGVKRPSAQQFDFDGRAIPLDHAGLLGAP